MNQLSRQDIELHTRIVGWLYIVGSALLMAFGLIGFFFLTNLGVITGDAQAALIIGIVGTWGGLLLIVLSVPGLLAGYGLLRRREWGRVLAIVVALLNLFNFPLGTLLGVYTLWVLLQTNANELFAQSKPMPA
ncbi:MAG: hypothetical protein IT331_14635 [Anaerolineae bacterium]|nr:hypothetical protein [Anaerolineae bacterium]